ncbi:antitoxin Xre/MbcA/ParS toxin-binding domain-containing protein [Pseudomonas sp. NPDC089395]|uniref:antitoxin Xre/MbcA/ParS toxin-binding domain-containing protein n=1 Tax=Pseudomonas sp. NPDC089395 TaxID=3364460 RepID=UPI00381D56D2
MQAIELLGACPSVRLRCWSAQFRCFVARQDQVRNQAAYVLGNARLASAWLTRPALGLDRRCPCSLLVDPDSYRQVGQYLTRIEYGVY